MSIRMAVVGASLAAFAASCSFDTEPDVIPSSMLRLHIESDVSGFADLELRQLGSDHQITARFMIPSVYELPLPPGSYSGRLTGGPEMHFPSIVIEDSQAAVDLELQFIQAVVSAQLPERYRNGRASLELRRRGHGVRTDGSVDAEGKVQFVFPYLLPKRYFPEMGGLDTSSSCPADTLDFFISRAASADLTTLVAATIDLVTPWPSFVDELNLTSSSSGAPFPLTWKGNTARAIGETACGSRAKLEIQPPFGNSLELELPNVTHEPVEVTWELGGLDLTISGMGTTHQYFIHVVGGSSESFLGPAESRWLLSPGTTSLDYTPTAPGAMPPHQVYAGRGSSDSPPPLSILPAEATTVDWQLLDGGRVEGMFSSPFLPDDEIGLTSTFGNSTWIIQVEEDNLTFSIEHTPIDSFLVRRTKIVDGRRETWWYPGTLDWREATSLFVESDKTLAGVHF